MTASMQERRNAPGKCCLLLLPFAFLPLELLRQSAEQKVFWVLMRICKIGLMWTLTMAAVLILCKEYIAQVSTQRGLIQYKVDCDGPVDWIPYGNQGRDRSIGVSDEVTLG